MDIITILSQIDLGSYAMPVFQRGYVWNREQVRKLMNSLYHGYPIGELLVWNTETDPGISRGSGPLTPGNVNLILDGQQRMTTLYGIIRGNPPRFFDGDASSFTNLYFNMDTESFEFYMAAKMKGDPAWINVTELMQKGASQYMQEKITSDPSQSVFWLNHLAALNKLDAIKQMSIHIETVSGADKTIDVVVEIFNNVNSGGTKLNNGDLALAKVCSEWSNAREELKAILARFSKAGYSFSIVWLLRCLTVYLTGQPYFNGLVQTPVDDVKKALPETEKMIGTCLDHIGTRLGLDHDKVLGGVFSIVTMIGYIRHQGGKLSGSEEWDKLLYWYVHAFLWGRYSNSTESSLAQDLNAIKRGDGIEGLLRQLKQSRGDLTVRPEDFWGWSTGARFFPLLYMLTRMNHARDWGTDLELSNSLLGKNSSLEVHHIFPKAVLYAKGKSKSIVNTLANYAFLTKETNVAISDREPEDYFPEYRQKCPGAMDTHWIPANQDLWKVENYDKFMQQRRILLAKAANTILDSLYNGSIAESPLESYATKEYHESRSEEEEIEELSEWMEGKGLKTGTTNHELIDDTGTVIAIIDLAWPQGIQNGLSEPVALLLNETAETQATVSRYGYRYYTSVQEFKNYVETVYLS